MKSRAERMEKHALTYKFKTHSNLWYIIRVEVYEDDLYTIKFYPKSLASSRNKYKTRIGKKDDWKKFSRIVATCFQVIMELREENPRAIFGFNGQWDKVDKDRGSQTSQRFRIYRMAIVSKFPEPYYHHISNEPINCHFMIPRERYSLAAENDLYEQIDKLFGDCFEGLRVPVMQRLGLSC